MYPLWKTLSELKEKKWVELSHLMNNDSPYWGGIPEGAVELGNVVFDWGNPMRECQIQQFKFPGQFGTHIDFPAHFKKGGVFAESFGMKDAVFPLCVVDISAKAAADPHYCVTVERTGRKTDRTWTKCPGWPRTVPRTSRAGLCRRSSTFTKYAKLRPTGMRPWIPTAPQRRKKPGTWPVNDTCWTMTRSRSRC